jgi:uncharacterized protein (TIGR02099 family)
MGDTALQPLLAGTQIYGYHVQAGHGGAQAWLDWKAGKLTRALARINIDDLTLSDGHAAAQLGALHGLVDLRALADGHQLRWADDDGGAMVLAAHQLGTPQARVGLAARRWQLAPWLPLLALRPGTNPALAQWLGHGRARALVSGAAVRWNQRDGLRALRVDFTDAAIDPAGKLPGVSALHGSVRGDAQALVLSVPGQASTLRMPGTFREPLVLTRLAGTLALWQHDDAWTLGIDALDVAGADYAAQVRGELAFPVGGGAPVADLYASVPHAAVTAAKAFWPLGSMSPATIAWLDRALVAGRIDDAQAVMRGNLADWPFAQHQGRFEARVPIRGLTLDYGAGWPQAEGVDVVAEFVNNSLHAQASGHALGVRAEQAVADIADFGAAPLLLAVRGSGRGAEVMRFVRQSPLGSRQAATLGKLALGGSASFDFNLQLPLHDDGEPQLAGTAQLHGADLRAPEWKLDLQQLDGALRFDAHGVQADAVRARFRGQPATLALAIGTVAGHEDSTVWAQLRGVWPLADLVRDYPSLAWIGQAASGSSDFSIGYSLAAGQASAPAAQQLLIDSSLRGTALDLPAPLHKGADTALPLQVSLGLPIDGSDVQINVGEVARVHLRLADASRPLAGVLAFGAQMPQELPAQGLRIRGHAANLDVTGWIQRTAGGGDGADEGPLVQDIRVSADQASWFGSPLGAMRIDADMHGDVLDATIEGAAIAGSVSVPGKALARQGVTGRLKHLYWPKEAAKPAPSATARSAPPPSVAVKSAPPLPEDNPAATGINPAALPPLHLWVGDLRLGDARLGEARLETWPTAEGMHIEQLRALSRDVQITASGDWNGSAQDSHTRMRVSFSAEDLGAMLGAFGFEGLVQGGRTHDQLDARWPGSPTALSLANMDGTLSVKVEDGRIPEAASPGVGRLLGLVSLAELPRRMTLDFGDVFGKGLAFDTITGDFRLADGNASTSNLTIVGSAAHIGISGRTGLRARDYDQEVLVIPRVGNSLPLVGAVVGGPVGAAAGFAVQSLLGKGLNKVASARYRITGPWSKPVMTLIEKHGVEVPSQPAPVLPSTPAPTPLTPPTPAPASSSAAPAPAHS